MSGWRHYEDHAKTLAGEYGQVSSAAKLEWLRGLMPEPPARVLDVGSGAGWDAAWFAFLGYSVTAVEPAQPMQSEGLRLHEGGYEWLADSLPHLQRVQERGESYDLISAYAVWMHIDPAERRLAFEVLAGLLAPGGLLALTVRDPHDPDRDMHPTREGEIPALAGDLGHEIVYRDRADDLLQRPGVTWMRFAVRKAAA